MVKKQKEETNFRKIIEQLSRRHGAYKTFAAFCRVAACALACETREAEYLEEAKLWTREELQEFAAAIGALVMEMEKQPFVDVLGHYYMEFAISEKSQQWGGEFHTPSHVCKLMAKMTFDGIPWDEDRPVTVCEPACGAGAMILAVGEICTPEQRRRLRVTAIDINRVACDMCFINTTLWGIPTRVYLGDTLRWQFSAAWSNIHWLMPWLPLAFVPQEDIIKNLPSQGAPPTAVETNKIQKALAQAEFLL